MNKKNKGTAAGIPVYCSHDEIVQTEKLVPNPKNPNTHPDKQIQMLAKIIKAAGWRQPITVSTRSGFIIKGHGRLMAAQLAGLEEVPVDYQNYETEADEYADLIADNRIAELADMDDAKLREIFADIDLSGIDIEITGYTDSEMNGIINQVLQTEIDKEKEKEAEAPAMSTSRGKVILRVPVQNIKADVMTAEQLVAFVKEYFPVRATHRLYE